MSDHHTEGIRNIALVGHAWSGKTALAETLLHGAGVIPTPGRVDKGTTVSDYDPQEQAHQHSIYPTVLHLDFEDTYVQLIDTPGYADFQGMALSALAGVETVAVVVNAQLGIESMTRRMMQWAKERKCCRCLIVNKIDADDVDLPGLVASLQDEFGDVCLPINLPAPGRKSVVDCFFEPSGDAEFSSVAEAHTRIIDQTVEVDEKLMEAYLERGSVQPSELHEPFERALREGHLVPICFASAETGAGVPELLKLIKELMPNPMEGNPPPFLKRQEEKETPVHAHPDSQQHVLAHVFRVAFDPFVGKIGIFRVHQGTVTRESKLFVGDARKAFKVGHLYRLQGKDHIEIERAVPGDICAISKVDDVHFDAVLHDSHDEDRIFLRPLRFPQPMFGLAVSARTRGDEQKLSDALHRLADEDPCLIVEYHTTTHETVLRGLGELHLRLALEKMRDRYHVEVDTRPPRIAYRETITSAAEGHYRHKKQTGGAGQFAEVYLKVEPLARGTGFEFVNAITGGVIPGQFVPAVEKGIRQAIEDGAVAGYPIQDVRVTVYDGKYHSVDSNEVSFVTAARKAFIDAVLRARPIVLEPIVHMEVTVPDNSMGTITGDLSSRRARINGTVPARSGMMRIGAMVPLAEVTDYPTRLKSITGGEGYYALEFSHYDPMPPNLQQNLAREFKQPTE